MTDLPSPLWRFPCPHCGSTVETGDWRPDNPCAVCCTSAPVEPDAHCRQGGRGRPLVLTRLKHLPGGYCRWEGRCPHCREATVNWFFATDGEPFRCPRCGGDGYTALFPTSRTPLSSSESGAH
ncbi:MAG: hypothetical protein OXI54_02550 [Chloroflexota bacterium]|nr:hypothetical protein [Chloroflexota bacterium]MDE2683016.1 hypothetical protein [Chloroflexota bacterium]